MFTEKIKELRKRNQLPQRSLAAALDIDTATYCKIEKGERKAKKEQVETLANILKVNPKDLLSLWLADKVTNIVSQEQSIADNALSLATKEIRKKRLNA